MSTRRKYQTMDSDAALGHRPGGGGGQEGKPDTAMTRVVGGESEAGGTKKGAGGTEGRTNGERGSHYQRQHTCTTQRRAAI